MYTSRADLVAILNGTFNPESLLDKKPDLVRDVNWRTLFGMDHPAARPEILRRVDAGEISLVDAVYKYWANVNDVFEGHWDKYGPPLRRAYERMTEQRDTRLVDIRDRLRRFPNVPRPTEMQALIVKFARNYGHPNIENEDVLRDLPEDALRVVFATEYEMTRGLKIADPEIVARLFRVLDDETSIENAVNRVTTADVVVDAYNILTPEEQARLQANIAPVIFLRYRREMVGIGNRLDGFIAVVEGDDEFPASDYKLTPYNRRALLENDSDVWAANRYRRNPAWYEKHAAGIELEGVYHAPWRERLVHFKVVPLDGAYYPMPVWPPPHYTWDGGFAMPLLELQMPPTIDGVLAVHVPVARPLMHFGDYPLQDWIYAAQDIVEAGPRGVEVSNFRIRISDEVRAFITDPATIKKYKLDSLKTRMEREVQDIAWGKQVPIKVMVADLPPEIRDNVMTRSRIKSSPRVTFL